MLRFLRHRDPAKTEQAVQKTRQTWFGRMAALFQRSELDDELWDQLEELLISADVGVGTTEKLLQRLRQRTKEETVVQPSEALGILKREMVEVLETDAAHEPQVVTEPPLVVLVVGVNGAGKTTSIAKLAQWHKDEGRSVVLGAADTFRAAAVEQLKAWGKRLEVDVIAHKPGADAGAVAFDTVQAAKARNADVAIIDTAGRLHTKVNLMEELRKIHRVLCRQGAADSTQVLLTLDATIGQNGLSQARSFVDAVECGGVFLAKLDGTAKGGIVLAISEELRLPVLYIGTGEQLDDISRFDPTEFVDGLFAPPEGDK